MIDFLAQTNALSDQPTSLLIGGGGIGLFVIKVGGDLFKTWILERTRAGKKLKNGSGCKMTKEANDVIVAKEHGRYLSQFPADDNKDQHDKLSLTSREISDTLLKVATTLDIMERRMK